MATQGEVKTVKLPGIPDGCLAQVGEDLVLTKLEVGGKEMTVESFLAALEGGLRLKELNIFRSEKRAKTKYETYEYSAGWVIDAALAMGLIDLVPEGQQRLEARKILGRMLTKRFKEIEEFLSRAVHSAQVKDQIEPYWRPGQTPLF